MSKKVLMPLPKEHFDPTETGVPWKYMKNNNIQVIFTTPDGKPARADKRMVDGDDLKFLKPLLMAHKAGRDAYLEMIASEEYLNPISWNDVNSHDYNGIILPGGHDKGMREYLESSKLQSVVCELMKSKKIVAAICHGVVLAARSRYEDGKSILFGKKTTSLLSIQEMAAYHLTRLWLKDYYLTYPQTVEDEVKESLENRNDFIRGPLPLFRDTENNLSPGFCLRDENYLSARWPGDAHVFSAKLLEMLQES
ncbi:MAG: hypothetical protein GY909_11845 [Oligoflexia bacterium]|nr:hypothetical protein [Oligoflexia bacterium]